MIVSPSELGNYLFADTEGAVTAWKRDMLAARSSPATVNQALAAVTLMYELAGLRIAVKRVRVPRPGEPDALTRQQEAALRRSAARRSPRDAAIVAVLLDTGARVEECARLDADLVAGRVRATSGRISAKRLLPERRAAGYEGSPRNFRWLVAAAKQEWRRGHRRGRRPAVWAPGEVLAIDRDSISLARHRCPSS